MTADDATLIRFALWRANANAGKASYDEVRAALRLVESARSDLETLESALLFVARAEGLTWPEIAADLGVRTPQAAQQRSQRLAGRAGGGPAEGNGGGDAAGVDGGPTAAGGGT